jgi:hypothetical protein
MTCGGGRYLHNAPFHSPLNPHKWKECPYCDRDGLIIIEAGVYAIVEYFQQLTEKQREELLEKIVKKNNGE